MRELTSFEVSAVSGGAACNVSIGQDASIKQFDRDRADTEGLLAAGAVATLGSILFGSGIVNGMAKIGYVTAGPIVAAGIMSAAALYTYRAVFLNYLSEME